MAKLVLLETIVVNYGDDRGGVIESAGDLITVTKETGIELTNHGRALYTRKGDDHSKGGLLTAPADVVSAAEERASTKGKPAKGAPEQKSEGNTET
ncbi:MAG TPA: hypothetical protein VLC92_01180 [Rhodocyclaceae bacterium]|nr:hypothetical protein [Rhodocyclaceae bacterium]